MLSLGTRVSITQTTLVGTVVGNAFSFHGNKAEIYVLVELHPGYWDAEKVIFTRLVTVHRENLKVLEAEHE